MLQQSALTPRLIMMFSQQMTDNERKKKADDSQVVFMEHIEKEGHVIIFYFSL